MCLKTHSYFTFKCVDMNIFLFIAQRECVILAQSCPCKLHFLPWFPAWDLPSVCVCRGGVGSDS